MARHPLLAALLRPRPFLLFGVQTPPQFILNTAKVALFTHLIWEHFYAVAEVEGPSMLPTIHIVGDWVLHSKLHSRGRGCVVGDLVSAIHPEDPNVFVLKRILGMPGDFVCVDPDPEMPAGRMVKVPEGHCWLAGDNLPHSRDSRMYGPVPLGLIRGKALARIWPKTGWFENTLKPVPES
ncbi:peptidase S24/S26A/S26B/S26C [Peziza echinospora]|nr:peptidase S24/S26A/S26B/S26C [Peziza echinospora]